MITHSVIVQILSDQLLCLFKGLFYHLLINPKQSINCQTIKTQIHCFLIEKELIFLVIDYNY